MKTTVTQRCRLLMACSASLGLALYFTAGRSGPAPVHARVAARGTPETMVLQAVVRDFRAKELKGGHPDFESYGNTYVRAGLLADLLDADGKPVVKSLTGSDVTKNFTDGVGRVIIPSLFNATAGDAAGTVTAVSTPMITSVAGFNQWYRDVSGVNVSKMVPITLTHQSGTNQYVFDSATDAPYMGRGGFFPIDGELFGNYGTTGHNFHFTTEIRSEFLCEKGKGQVFKFTGDDDVWVYINGRLVIDLGGLHPKREQYLELDRLTWLEDGKIYPLAIFHAERHTTQSNFRIETNLGLRPLQAPATSGLYD